MSLNGLGGIIQLIDKFCQGIYPQSTLTYASSQYFQYISVHPSPIPTHPQYIHSISFPVLIIPLQSLSNPYSILYNPIQFIPSYLILPVLPNHSNILIPSIPSSTPISIPITFSVFSTLPIPLIKSNQIPISHPSQYIPP